MAKALTYQRFTQEVMTVDTVNNNLASLGVAFATADQTTLFAGRSENLVCVFNGDPYFLWLDTVGSVNLSVFTSGAWAAVGTFPTIPSFTGTLAPIGLYVDRDRLVALVWRSNSAAQDGLVATQSQDGATWGALQSLVAPVQPTVGEGGHAVSWHNAIHVATASGIAWFDPVANTLSAAFDTGSDTLLAAPETTVGNFCFWNGDLYFAKHGNPPAIYRLPAFDPTSPPASPMWDRVPATGLLTAGAITVSADSNTSLLFVNKVDELCLLYSGQITTKLLKMDSSEYPTFTTPQFVDITTSVLPAGIVARTDLSFSLFVDDRRRVNELQSILIRDSGAGDTILMSWDGTSTMDVRTTFTSVELMPCNERFGAQRIYTALQPTSQIDSISQPFPGRVVLNYTVRDASSRKVDIFGEYSVDGDEWNAMSEGDGDSGWEQLNTTPAGLSYVFYWDAWVDLSGVVEFVNMRVVARLSGV